MSVDQAFNSGSTTNIGNSDSALVAANSNRTAVIITNGHATQTVSLSLGGTAVADSGIRLQPNQTIILDNYRGAIRAIASGASTNVLVAEY